MSYTIQSAEFVISNQTYTKCPEPKLPEYAFIGRSNVGKSSLINAFTQRKKLAKTSGTPGKTQLINHFLINKDWYLVDLPGYGFAKVSKKLRQTFKQINYDYLLYRPNLINVFVLVDIRHEPQKTDLDFLQWMGENSLPFALVFTKADKLSKQQQEASVERFKTHFLEIWEFMPEYFVTSAEKAEGLQGIWDFIKRYNEGFEVGQISD